MTVWTSAGETNLVVSALIKAQGQMTAPVKDVTGQSRGGKYQYASLAAVREALLPALTANDLAIVQAPGILDDTNVFILHTMIIHSSGQWIASDYPICRLSGVEDGNPFYAPSQALGSALTYARRYAWLALCGQVPEDDDGDAATQAAFNPARRPQAPPPSPMKTAATPPTSQSAAAGPSEVSQGLGGAPPRTRQVTEAILKTAADKGTRALLEVYENVLTVPEAKLFKAHIERVLMPIAQQVDEDRRADEAVEEEVQE